MLVIIRLLIRYLINQLAISISMIMTLEGCFSCNSSLLPCFVIIVFPEIELSPNATNVSIVVEDIELSCSASGFPFPTITWLHNGTDIDETDVDITIQEGSGDDFGTVSSYLRINDTEIPDSGEYMCVASNGFGDDAESDNVTVLVQGIDCY